jgi:hypothetical protein
LAARVLRRDRTREGGELILPARDLCVGNNPPRGAAISEDSAAFADEHLLQLRDIRLHDERFLPHVLPCIEAGVGRPRSPRRCCGASLYPSSS